MSRLPHRLQDGFGPLTRRQMLKGSALAAIAATLPTVVPGGDSSSEAADAPLLADARETRTLHFDLSLFQGQLKKARLIALRSAAHGAPLRAHTDASRRRHRAQRPALAAIPDAQLTHYIEDVDLPSDALQLLTVTGTHAATGEPVLCGMHVHIPGAALTALASQSGAPASLATSPGNDYANPLSTAVSLVFHHPEVMNLNVEQGAAILTAIQTLPCRDGDTTCTPFINTLAFAIASKWPATTTPGGWATLVPLTEADGTPARDEQGNPIYRYDLDDEVAATTAQVAQEVLKFIFDDPRFQGNNWHATQGLDVVSQAPVSAARRAGLPQAGEDSLAVAAAYGVGGYQHGVEFVGLEVRDPAERLIRLSVKNWYLRFLSAYVMFYPPGANTEKDSEALPVANSTKEDSTRAKFVTHILTNDSIMGIPLSTEGLIDEVDIEFVMPKEAAHAKVLFAGLGMGDQAFSPEALAPSLLTIGFNIGVPMLFLSFGIATTPNSLRELFENKTLLSRVAEVAKEVLFHATPEFSEGLYGIGSSESVRTFILQASNAAIEAFIGAVPEVAATISREIGLKTAEQAATGIFVVMKVISVLADLALIGTTLGEVLASPAIFANTISLTMDTTVIIHKDPNDFQFPARARTFWVTATYSGKLTREMTGTIEQGRVDPIEVIFTGVPSGGTLKIEVLLSTADGFIVGHASTKEIQNTLEMASEIAVTITEEKVPLAATTQYEHEKKLDYQQGQHVWVDADAPTATVADLHPGQDNTLQSLDGITVHTATGMAGYGFEADGIASCFGAPSAIYHTVQNVFLADHPDSAYKELRCGFSSPVGIAYDPQGDDSGVGKHFFLEPTSDGTQQHLRSVTLDHTTTPLNPHQTLSWGRFTQALDSLVVHASGWVVGVNRQNHKMEILQLPAEPIDDSKAPQSVPFAVIKSGLGTREGLMNEPVAVASRNKAILVLEQGNRRVQAFSVGGDPAKIFKKKTTSLMPLRDEGDGVVYLDLGVEAMGYIYVLSYINDGQTVQDYRLDVYDPDGNFQSRTVGIAAARMAVDTFRNVYTLNYETIDNVPHIEPSLSQWVPVTPRT